VNFLLNFTADGCRHSARAGQRRHSGLDSRKRTLRFGFLHGESPLREPGGEISDPRLCLFLLQAVSAGVDRRPAPQDGGAAGGSILLRREMLERAGGVAAIRSEIIDDCALARLVKDHGGRIWLGLTKGTSSLRPYGTFGEIGRMISRTAFNQLNHSILLLLGSLAGMIVIYLLPVLLFLSGPPIPMTLGAATCLLMALAYLPLIRFYRLNPLWSLSLPLISIFYMGATLHSASRYWSGRGGEWKGRMQDREAPANNP
jgi:Glycosyl transferase family 21